MSKTCTSLHDPAKLLRKSKIAHGRNYTLKPGSASVLTPAPAGRAQKAATLPAAADLRHKKYMPAVLNQGTLGSCVSQAMANNLCFLMGKEGLPQMQPSRLALYYNTRVLVEGQPADQDNGVTISDMCIGVGKYHACPEADWPYDISKFALPPPEQAVKDEAKHTKFGYLEVPQDEEHIKTSLADGFPVILGIQVYSSFESEAVAETGIVPMPNTATEQLLGGHAQLLCGFCDAKQAFLSLNSWGGELGRRRLLLDPLCLHNQP